MSEGEKSHNGRAAIIERLKPLANVIAIGTFTEEEPEAEIQEMLAQGQYIFPKLNDEERLGIRHPNKPNVTYLAAFLYKHSAYPLSPYAASVAAQRYLHPSTRRKKKLNQEPWRNGWIDD